MIKELFKDYYKRLAKEGMIKAFLCALFVGFCALFLSAAVFWLTGFKHVWLCAIVFVVVTVGVAPIFYYKKFKPDTKAIAKRIDELGLEERLVTMTELEGDESYMAKRQRADAMEALSTVKAGLVPIVVAVPLIVAVVISGVMGLGMTTVSALSAAEVIRNGSEIMNPTEEPVIKEFEVVYEVMEGEGEIVGADGGDGAFQIVFEGDDAEPVRAVPEDGWAFLEWSDGLTDPYRQDFGVKEDLLIFAIFGQVEEGEGGGSGSSGSGSGSAGDMGETGDKGSPPEEGEEGGKTENELDDGQGPGAGGRYEPNNQVFDGNTYFGGETYESAYEDAMNNSENGNYSDDEKDVFGNYLENIRK